MMGLIFKNTRTALVVIYFVVLYFMICSGVILNLKDTTNPVFKELSHYSPFRFATEMFMRQSMESNDNPEIDGYLETLDYKFKIQDYPFITNLSIIFFIVSWILIAQKTKAPKQEKK